MKQKQKWDWKAIVGFISSFIIAVVGLIFCILSLTMTDWKIYRGKGLAVAGLIIAILNMLLGLIWAIALL
jgi:hypothetical protein